MEQWIADVTSLYWWLSVVIAGILINLLSFYVKTYFDRAFSRFSEAIRTKSDKNRRDQEALVEMLRADQHKQLIYLSNEQRCRSRALLFSIFGLVCLVWAQILGPIGFGVLYFAGGIMFLFVAHDHNDAMNFKRTLRKVHPDLVQG